jgi:hypothetical protein
MAGDFSFHMLRIQDEGIPNRSMEVVEKYVLMVSSLPLLITG